MNKPRVLPPVEKLLEDRDLLDPYIRAIISQVRLAVLDKNFTIIWVNDEFCRLSRYSEHELIGKPIDRMEFGFQDHPEIFSVVSDGEKWSGELKSVAKDGSVYWVKANVLPIRNRKNEIESYLILSSNITATKNALDEKNLALENLLRSEARYRALVENQSDLISLCKPDGTRIFVNGGYCKFFGKNYSDLIGVKIQELPLKGIPPEVTHEIFSLTVDSPERSGIFEVENAQGKKVWMALVVKGIFDSDGNLAEILTIGRDVTELKMAELRKSNYVEDLERIAFMTSHNVRGPIATALGLIELLKMNAIHSDQWGQVLDSFKKCINDLDVCTRELGAFIYLSQSQGRH